MECESAPLKAGGKVLAEILRDSPLREHNAERERQGLPPAEFDASLPKRLRG